MIGIAIVLFVVGLILLVLAAAPPALESVAIQRVKAVAGFAAIILGCALFLAAPVRAEERARLSQQGCSVAADMTLVARSLSEAGVERAAATAVMRMVYAEYSDGGQADKLRDEILALGYRRKEDPVILAKMIGGLCMANGGSLDQALGSPVRWRF